MKRPLRGVATKGTIPKNYFLNLKADAIKKIKKWKGDKRTSVSDVI